MKANKLVYIFLLAVLMGFGSQATASLMSFDGEGSVTSITGIAPPGSISIGDAFSSVTVFDPTTTFDTNEATNIGTYNWTGDIFQSHITVGDSAFTTGATKVTIYNDMFNGSITYDYYRIDSWGTLGDELILFNIVLSDSRAQALDSDAFVAEPGLENFPTAFFEIRSWNINTYEFNYSIMGNLTSFVDPVFTASVPEPNTVFLLGLGLIAVFFASKGFRTEDKFAA